MFCMLEYLGVFFFYLGFFVLGGFVWWVLSWGVLSVHPCKQGQIIGTVTLETQNI